MPRMNPDLKDMKKLYWCLLILLLTGAPNAPAAPLDPDAVAGFIAGMEKDHGFDRQELAQIFAHAKRSDEIIKLMSRPAEKVKPWWSYRNIFISDKRINDGAKFWRKNQQALELAEKTYGVDPSVIVAIIGVETSYGRVTGNHRVLDALSTLAFHYPGDRPKRAAYFRAQLEHFLLFSREAGAAPHEVKGSYAGALGMPQFMPENYRKLAVDFDHDGIRDIWKNPADAIGSVANYLNHHGWTRAGAVMSPARVAQATPSDVVQSDIKPTSTLQKLAAAGVTPMIANANGDEQAALYEFEARNGTEYWIGYNNFYVISRYNPRLKYTMAVAQLAVAIGDVYSESN